MITLILFSGFKKKFGRYITWVMILHGIEYQRPTSLNMRIMADHVTYSFLAFMKSIFHFCLGCYCGGYSQNGRSNLSSLHRFCVFKYLWDLQKHMITESVPHPKWLRTIMFAHSVVSWTVEQSSCIFSVTNAGFPVLDLAIVNGFSMLL